MKICKSKMEMQMVETVEAIECDVCKRRWKTEGDDIMEVQEFHHINFVGGYDSVFGDSMCVRLDICQHCLKDLLGKYLRIETE